MCTSSIPLPDSTGRTLRCLAGLIVTLAALAFVTLRAAEVSKSYDIPAGPAETTLKQFSEQSGHGVVFVTDVVRGTKTHAVKGELTPAAALDAMLADTGLMATQDQKTGAFAVRKGDRPNVSRAALTAAPARNDQGEEAVVSLDEYEVTGLRVSGLVNEGVIARKADGAMNFIVLDRTAIEHSGAVDIANLFQRIVPQNTRYGTGSQDGASVTFSVAAVSGGIVPSETLNLRGFGGAQTVVLINGRRTFGGEDQPGDVNRIPLSAIDRIEILPGSASSIYGAGATGGIINIILKKGSSGTEIIERFGVSSRGDALQNAFTIVSGRAFNDDRTQLTWTLDHTTREELRARERDYHLRALDRLTIDSPLRVGTSPAFNIAILPYFAQTPGTIYTSSSLRLGIPGNPTAAYAVVPAGNNGTGLTPAAFTTTAGQVNVGAGGRVGESLLLSGMTKVSFNAQLEHAFARRGLGAYLEFGLSRQELPKTDYFANIQVAGLGATDPRNPFRTNITPGFVGRSVNVYWRPVDLPASTREGTLLTGRLVGGLKGEGEWNERRWGWALDGSWEGNDNDGESLDYALALIRLLSARLYNPARDVAAAPHDRSLFTDNSILRQHRLATQIGAVNLRWNSDLFRMPAGWSRASLGAELRWEDFFNRINTTGQGLTATSTDRTLVHTSRRASSGYFEVTAPVFGGDHRRPGLHELELSFAGRAEAYDDFTGPQNYLAAVRWQPVRDLTFRGSYGGAYNPPSQVQLDAAIEEIELPFTFAFDPRRDDEEIGIGVLYREGGNPDLRAETSDTLNYGVIYAPALVPGLKLGLDFFHISKEDQIEVDSVLDAILANEALFPGRITRAPASPADVALGYPGPVTRLDVRAINLSRVDSRGVDFRVNWQGTTEQWGRFSVQGVATYTQSFRTRLTAVSPEIETVGYVGLLGNPPVKLRGNLSLYWDFSQWTTGVTARYIHSYATDSTELTPANAAAFNANFDGPAIASSTEFDFDLGYRLPYAANAPSRWRRWLGGTRWSLRVNNVFDRDPPYLTDRQAFYSRFNDPRGRYLLFEFKKTL